MTPSAPLGEPSSFGAAMRWAPLHPGKVCWKGGLPATDAGPIRHAQVIRRIDLRVAEWTHLPPSHAEDMQVLRYQNGQKCEWSWDPPLAVAGSCNWPPPHSHQSPDQQMTSTGMRPTRLKAGALLAAAGRTVSPLFSCIFQVRCS